MSELRFATLEAAEVVYGRVDQVSPTIRRVIAENPSKFTYHGTGTYIIGRGDVVVIDPGPLLDSHRDALAAALAGERVRAILVTHCHADHSPLAAWLTAETGAPTVAFGSHPRPAEGATDQVDGEPEDLGVDAEGKPIRIEETVDHEFSPTHAVADGDPAFVGAGMTFTAVHTPGHTSNHTCFAYAEESALFTGDHVMGWSTTVVSPPDGDMAAYIESLDKVARRTDSVLWPTHGPPRHDGVQYIQNLVAHRRQRERQVVEAVRSGLSTIPEMVALLYAEVRTELHKAAGRSVYAHLMKSVADGELAVEGGGQPGLASRYVAVR
jgi:glyoxylase-like metal-dependent hydrolase (beta-lactamase superfamily II)